jgi:hypothetical protein
MWVPEDDTNLRGSQALLGQFVNLLHVVRHQFQSGGDAPAIGQSPLGQALPRSMHATHDGGGLAAKSCLHFFFFLLVLGLKLRAYTLSHSTSPCFCDGFFQDRVLRTVCPVWIEPRSSWSLSK